MLGFTIGVFSAYWVAQATHEFLQLSWPLSAIVLLVFAASCAQPHLLLVGPLFHWGAKRFDASASAGRSVLVCLALSLLYTGLDGLVPRLFDVGLGYALHGAPRLRQLADIGGVSLLTFVIVSVNLLLWRGWEAWRSAGSSQAMIGTHLLVVAVILSLGGWYGSIRNRANAALVKSAGSSLLVGIVQGNVANEVRLAWARGGERDAEKQLAAYMLPTEDLAQQTPAPELLVWPEATFPGVFRQPRSKLQQGRANKFDRQIMRLNRPIVFGAYDMETDGSDRILYNAVFAITPRYDTPGSQGTVGRYRKHRLLPFAETIPGVSQTAWFRRNLPSLGFFGAGSGPALLEIETPSRTKVKLGPIICSESLSSQHVIETAKLGADVLLNVGSDGWFGQWGEPQFHLAAAQLRSVETRRPQIRAANTGISAVILPGGEISGRSALGSETTLSVAVPLTSPDPSLMMRWGDWFGWASLVSGFLILMLIVFVKPVDRGEVAS